MASGLKDRYEKAVKDELRKRFSYDNVMRIPRVEKIVLNIGMGESIGNAKAMDAAAGDLEVLEMINPIIKQLLEGFPIKGEGNVTVELTNRDDAAAQIRRLEEVGFSVPKATDAQTLARTWSEVLGGIDADASPDVETLLSLLDSRKVWVKLSGPNQLCRDILTVTGVANHFEIYRELKSAVGSFLH